MGTDQCPPILSPGVEPGYSLSTPNRTVNTIVNVLCHNHTVSVLKCLPSYRWNATKAACPSELEVEAAEEYQVETIIIIVWVLGGVLLLALLALLAVIISSHKKDVRGNPHRTSIFTVSSNRNSRGGDNPAFTTENETPSSQSHLHRNGVHRSSLRPPSYHEAVSGQLMSLPGLAARMSPHGARAAPTGNRREINSPRGRREDGSRMAHGARGRYVYDYPTCYWEEEPPPPYSLVVGDRPEASARNPPTSGATAQARGGQHPPPDRGRIHHIERHRPQTSAPLARSIRV